MEGWLADRLNPAGRARAEVTVRYAAGGLRLEVVDDGQGPPATSGTAVPGHGQLGMYERVSVWGGSLTTGKRPGGGYRVAARLPYGNQDQQ